jgi:phosphoglycerate dehydrogenase-like enzyme
MTHVVITANELRDEHIERVRDAIRGWGTVERIDDRAPEPALINALRAAEVVFGLPSAHALLQSNVKLCQLSSVGYNNYIGKGLEQKPDFILCNASGTMGPGIAEHVLALMLAQTRHLAKHIRDDAQRRWEREPAYGELFGATVCVVGLGDLGTAVAERCAALGMNVIGVRHDASKGHPVAKQVYATQQLNEAVAHADHVVAMLPASEETKHLFNADVFSAMKPGARFYNAGRGSTVDEQALIAALESGHLGGAGLDVFEREPLPEDSPLWNMAHVIVTPHVAGRSTHEYDRQCDLLIENLQHYHAGEPLRNVIALD